MGTDRQVWVATLAASSDQGIRVSYLDWGAFSHGLFLQAPSKQRKEKSTKQKERKEMEKENQSIDGSFVQ